jgi:hypothetical protein
MFIFGQFSDVAKMAIIHKTIDIKGVKCGGSLLCMTHSQLLEGLKCESQIENSGRIRNRGMFLSS